MWEIKRAELINGLQELEVVPEKLGIPSSEYFWVRGTGSKITLSISSYISGEITLEGNGDWPFKHDFYIDRRVLLPFVYAARELKNKHRFQFERVGKSLLLKHGSRKVELTTQKKVTGYGNLSKILKDKGTTLPVSDDLRELLLCGRNCAVSDSVVPHLNCVFVSKSAHGNMAIEAYAASDKVFYLGIGKVEGKVKSATPFPLFLINLLSLPGLKKISWVGKYIVMTMDNGYIWQPISEEALTKFPLKKIQKHAFKADKLPVTFTASSRRFSRLMVRLGYYLQSVRRKDWVVKIKGTKSKEVLAITTDIPGAKFVERISTSAPIKKDFKMEWPLDILEPVFDFLSKKTKKLGVIVRIDEKHGVSYIRTGSFWLAVPSRQEK